MKERYIITNINPMKTKTIIEELTQEDLVDLLCAATYGSEWLSCHAPNPQLYREDGDCLEDIWAKALLSGGKLICVDHLAESCVYGENEDFQILDGGEVEYGISLADIKKGLELCSNYPIKRDADYLRECLHTYIECNGGIDLFQAEALMQIIIFGELIYG